MIDDPGDAAVHGHGTLADVEQGVSINNVTFDYPDGSRALSEVTLEGRIGEMIALTGATGAGKSTLAYLVPAFVTPTTGQVLIDGVDVCSLSVASLRQQVAFVFQEAVVFDDTAANNIRLGNPEASDDEVRRAAAAAGALGFIEKLPQGFDTRLGRGGGTLSVGQKQRIAIARGLVSRAPILVLDEPTAALDPETENALVSALNAERHKRLLIVIAHRLSTIASADRIYFLNDGKVLESGSHEELMTREGGAYREYVELQMGTAA